MCSQSYITSASPMTYETIRSETSLVSALSRWQRAGKTVARDAIVGRSFQTLTVKQRHCRVEVVDSAWPNILGERVRRVPRKIDPEAVVDVVLRQPGAIHQTRTSRRASMKVGDQTRVSSVFRTHRRTRTYRRDVTGTRQRVRMLYGSISVCIINDINWY